LYYQAYKNNDNLILEIDNYEIHLFEFIRIQSKISKLSSTGILNNRCYTCSFNDRLGQYILKNYIKA